MNEVAMEVAGPTLELNPKLDCSRLSAEFQKAHHVQIHDCLLPGSATQLNGLLSRSISWQSFVLSDGELFSAPAPAHEARTVEEEGELLKYVHAGARKGFAYWHDADRLFPEDVPEGADPAISVETPLMRQLREFFCGPAPLGLIRSILGVPEVERVALQATRFRSGQFEMFHGGTYSADKTRKRVAGFNLNMTPEWKPEWGGLLHFRTWQHSLVDAYVPCFNSLELFSFPQGYWISTVAEFSDRARLAISGRLYIA